MDVISQKVGSHRHLVGKGGNRYFDGNQGPSTMKEYQSNWSFVEF